MAVGAATIAGICVVTLKRMQSRVFPQFPRDWFAVERMTPHMHGSVRGTRCQHGARRPCAAMIFHKWLLSTGRAAVMDEGRYRYDTSSIRRWNFRRAAGACGKGTVNS